MQFEGVSLAYISLSLFFWSLNSNHSPKFSSFLCQTGFFCFRGRKIQNMGRTNKKAENAPAARIKNTAVNQSSFSKYRNQHHQKIKSTTQKSWDNKYNFSYLDVQMFQSTTIFWFCLEFLFRECTIFPYAKA